MIVDKPGDVELTLTYTGQSSPAPMPLPDVAAAGYSGVGVPNPNKPAMIYTLTPDGTNVTVPQRTLSIANRDVVTNWQNAWGGVWLTRNEQLVLQPSTNPAFIYRTPEIRFNTPAVPLLRDSQLRNVALIGGTGQARTLVAHIKALFSALFPVAATYTIKLTCTYSFYVATPAVGSNDSALAASVPVLLYRQPTDLASDAFYVQVAGWLDGWRVSNTLPTEISNSFYQFGVALFSSLGADAGVDGQEHVLLEVNNFQLAFKDII